MQELLGHFRAHLRALEEANRDDINGTPIDDARQICQDAVYWADFDPQGPLYRGEARRKLLVYLATFPGASCNDDIRRIIAEWSGELPPVLQPIPEPEPEEEPEEDEEEDDIEEEEPDYAFVCEHCDEARENDCEANSVRMSGWDSRQVQTWCDDCVTRAATTCHNCSETFSDSEICNGPDNNNRCCECHSDVVCICPDCESEHIGEPDCSCGQDVFSYHSDLVRFDWKSPEPGDWGIEIEISSDDRCEARDIANKWDWAGERDGSLSDSKGIELISPPMRFPELVKSVSGMVGDLHRSRIGVRGWNAGKDGNSYGIHVSFDRRAWSELTILRFTRMINANPLGLCEFIAGRNCKAYAEFCPKEEMLTASLTFENKGKFFAVNAEKGRNRVEVRIFRSTLLHRNGIAVGPVACLQFVRAALHFSASQCVPHDDCMLAKRFLAFIQDNPREFKELRHRLAAFARERTTRDEFAALTDLFPKELCRLGMKTATGGTES